MPFNKPHDLDYTAWREDFLSVLHDRCVGGTLAFTKSSLSLGSGLLSSLRNQRSQAVLEDVLTGGSISPFLGRRWAYIFLTVLGLIFFIIGLAASCGIWKGPRRFYSRWLCGTCRSRSRPRFKNVKPRFRSILCLVSIIAGGCTVGLASLFLVSTTQVVTSIQSSQCAVWLQLYGHYFGTDSIDSREFQDIARNWHGTIKLRSDIRALAPRLQPGYDNPVYTSLKGLQGPLMETATNISDYMIDMAYEARNLSNFHSTFLADAWGAIPKKSRGSRPAPTLGVHTVLLDKTAELVNVTTTLLKQGDELISTLLDRYAGPQSQLMAKGYQAVLDSLETVSQIDQSIGILTRLWHKASRILNILSWILVAISFIVGATCIALVLGNIILAFFLLKHLRQDSFVRSKERLGWKVLYVGYAVCAGLAAFLASIYLLTAAVGSDVCPIVDESLLTQGKWDLLGQDIFHPSPNATIDFKAVLETCVRKGGLGNVAVSMFLDGRIAELSQDVSDAQDDIISSQNDLLKQQEQIGRIDNLGMAYQEVLRSHVSKNVREDKLNHDILQPIFEDYRIVHFDEKHQDLDGENVLFCFLPTMTITPCLSAGLWYVVASPNDAYDYLNKFAQEVHNTNSSSKFPSSFCGYLGARTGTCGELADSVWLDNTLLPTNLETWSKEIPENMTFEKYDTYMQERALHLMRTLWLNELVANYTTTETSPYTDCPELGCTYDLWRRQDQSRFEAFRDLTSSNLTQLLQLFDSFVYENVVPEMQSLVTDADALTDHANCQFEGTAIRYGALEPLCEGVFPGALASACILAILAICLLGLAAHAWQWALFIIDLTDAFNRSPSGYETPAFLSMSQRAEYVAYTGLPSSGARREWESARIDSDIPALPVDLAVRHGQNAPKEIVSEVNRSVSSGSSSFITHCTDIQGKSLPTEIIMNQGGRSSQAGPNARSRKRSSISSYASYHFNRET